MLASPHHADAPHLPCQITNYGFCLELAARDSRVVNFASKLQRVPGIQRRHLAQVITVCKQLLTKDGRPWYHAPGLLLVKSGPCFRLNFASKVLCCRIHDELILCTKVEQPDFNESKIFGNVYPDCNIWQKPVDLYHTIDRHYRLSQDQLQGSEKLPYEVFRFAKDFQKNLCDLLDFTKNYFDCDLLDLSVLHGLNQLKQRRRAMIEATELQWYAYYAEISSHEPVPCAATQQPDANENCPPPCLQHAPASMPMPPAPLGIAALVSNVALHCKYSTGVTPSSQSGTPAGSITMVVPGDAPQKCRQSWNPTGAAEGRVSVLDGFEYGHGKDTHPGGAIPTRKSLFITCIFASTWVFFLGAAAILLSFVCQPQVNVGNPLLSMENFFGSKRRCENDQTLSVENVAPAARTFFVLSIIMVLLCDHIDWRYFLRKTARFLCYLTQYHFLSTCQLASQFCPTNLSPCQTTDVVFSTSPSPRQAVLRLATPMASGWRHGRLASTSNVKKYMSISSHLFYWRNFCRCSSRIYFLPHGHFFSRIAACVRSALLPAALSIDSSSGFIPRPLRALSPPVDEESRALNRAVAQFYTDLVFFFFQAVNSFNLRRVSSIFRAIALFSVLRITWLKRKRLCMKRAVTSVVLVLCVSTAPLSAKAQVCVQPSDL